MLHRMIKKKKNKQTTISLVLQNYSFLQSMRMFLTFALCQTQGVALKQGVPSSIAFLWYSVQSSSVSYLCPTLCDPMNHSTPGLPVHHQLLEFTQTHVHLVSDAIQPCHALSSPSPPAPNPSQHQGLYQWVNSSHEVAKYWSFPSASVLPKKSQGWSSEWTGWISLQSKGLS